MPIKITTDSEILKDKSINFVDMHHHSKVSDGKKSPAFIVKYFAKSKKGVCIADHNEIKGAVYLSKQKKVFSIPAIEITSKEMVDICAYFYNVNDLVSFWKKEIKNNVKNDLVFNLHRTKWSAIEIIEKIKDYNGISVLPHPLIKIFKQSYKLLSNKEFLKKVDGVEVINFIAGNYQKTIDFAKKIKKSFTAGTDSHIISKFNALTGSYEFKREDFLESLLKKKNIIYYKPNDIFTKFIEQIFIIKNALVLRF